MEKKIKSEQIINKVVIRGGIHRGMQYEEDPIEFKALQLLYGIKQLNITFNYIINTFELRTLKRQVQNDLEKGLKNKNPFTIKNHDILIKKYNIKTYELKL